MQTYRHFNLKLLAVAIGLASMSIQADTITANDTLTHRVDFGPFVASESAFLDNHNPLTHNQAPGIAPSFATGSSYNTLAVNFNKSFQAIAQTYSIPLPGAVWLFGSTLLTILRLNRGKI